MQGWRTVQQDRIFADDLIEHVPYFRAFFLNHPFGAFQRRHVASLFQFVIDKWLKQLNRHLFRQAALMHLQLGTHHNHRAA
jgi:hypothetical protein